MAPTMEEAERFLKCSRIQSDVLEKLAEMLVTKLDDWHLITDQRTAESVWVVLTEAGRSGKLSDNLGDADVARHLANVFEKIRTRLQIQLNTIQWERDKLIDWEVKISRHNKSSLQASSSLERVVLTLKLLPAGKTEVESFVVDFDEAQLEDFIWKLKEAKAMRGRIQKKIEGQ